MTLQQEFGDAAAGFPEPFRLLCRDAVGSTNDELHELAQHGAPEGMVVLADHQSAGRGRRGTAWFSPPGQALAFSVLFRPSEPKALWPRLALAAGLAVAEALEPFGLHPGIKWPNDVWLGKRKAAGILLEAGNDFVVVGIGLNVNATDFPAEVADLATSMAVEGGCTFDRGEVLGAIIHQLARRARQIGQEFGDVIAAVQERCVLTGNHVTLITPAGQKSGTIEGIAAGGELLLRTPAGIEKLIQADEVRFS